MVQQVGGDVAVVDPWERARKAHTDIINGESWDTVMQTYEYADINVATMDVRGYLSYVHTMTGDDEREVAKRLELDRLDVLHREWWPLATQMHDKDAAMVVLKVGERRAKLLELETISQRQGSHQTIVITDGNFADDLRQIALAQEEAKRAGYSEAQDDVVEGELVV